MKNSNRVLLFVPVGKVDKANAIMVKITGNSEDVRTFDKGFSSTGKPPYTHYAASLVADDALRVALKGLLTDVVVGSNYWVSDVEKGDLLETDSQVGTLGKEVDLDEVLLEKGVIREGKDEGKDEDKGVLS